MKPLFNSFDPKLATLSAFIYLRSLSLNKTVEISQAFYEEDVLSKKTVLKMIETVSDIIPSQQAITKHFKPQRSGYYALDGTWFKYLGNDFVLLVCFDVKTLDVVEYSICESETYQAYKDLLLSCGEELNNAKGFFFDGDPGLIKTLKELFPTVSKQLCVFHKQRRCAQIIPFVRTSKENEPLKDYVNKVLYATSTVAACQALHDFSVYVKDHKHHSNAQKLLGSLKTNFEYLITHFENPEMSPYNNVLEGFNAIINTRINLMKGFKKGLNVHRHIKLIIVDYRLHRLKESRFKDRNGKSPLELAGCNIPKFYNSIDFILDKFNVIL